MMQSNDTTKALEVLVLQQSAEIKKLKAEGRAARRILLTFRKDYMMDCACEWKENFHCLPCQISDWLHKYETNRKKDELYKPDFSKL